MASRLGSPGQKVLSKMVTPLSMVFVLFRADSRSEVRGCRERERERERERDRDREREREREQGEETDRAHR
jgi:hypothetical protein